MMREVLSSYLYVAGFITGLVLFHCAVGDGSSKTRARIALFAPLWFWAAPVLAAAAAVALAVMGIVLLWRAAFPKPPPDKDNTFRTGPYR